MLQWLTRNASSGKKQGSVSVYGEVFFKKKKTREGKCAKKFFDLFVIVSQYRQTKTNLHLTGESRNADGQLSKTF